MERESVGPYRILERLGAGGMGEVFLALDTRLNRRVALKSLTDPSLDAPRARARLLREARAAAHISHPNIAGIYDILESGDDPCIVMEYAEGEPLSALVARGPVPCAQVLHIATQVVDAVAHAHAAGVIHRDLKPSNIVLTSQQVVKILDFGLARTEEPQETVATVELEATRDQTASRVGRVAGTPAYMAPEQLLGYPASPQSDIYSLGATLFELLAGRRPFLGPTPSALALEIVSSPTPLVTDVAPGVPVPMARVIAKAMAKTPGERYQSAAEMGEDLRQAHENCGPAHGAAAAGGATAAVTPASGAGSWSAAGATSSGAGASSGSGGVRTLAGTPWLAMVAGLVSLAALFVAGYTVFRFRAVSAPAGPPQFVAVVAPQTRADDADAALEAAGFAEAAVATLEGLSSVSLLSLRAAQSLSSSGDARKDALAAGVTRVITGSLGGPAARRTLSLRVEDAAGKALFARNYSAFAAQQGQALRDIVAALRLPLTREDDQRMASAPACRAATYKEIARARALLAREDVGGNPARAEAILREAVAKDSSCALALAGLSDASWARYAVEQTPGLSDRAREVLVDASRLDPNSPAIRLALARLYRNTGRLQQAEQALREVIQKRPVDDEPHRLLSVVLGGQNRNEEAEAELQRAIQLRPNSALNHLVLGNWYYGRAKFDEALESYRRVVQIQPDNEWGILNTIAVHAMLGHFQQALDLYEASPVKNATMRTNMGGVYFALGRCAEAAQFMREAVEMEPRDHVKRRNLGDAYACIGRRDDAMREYRAAVGFAREALKINAADPEVLSRLAVYEAKCGLKDEALQHVADALALAQGDQRVLYKAAAAYSLLRRPAQAVDRLREALDKGYSRVQARVDPDLDAIRSIPAVKEMLGAK